MNWYNKISFLLLLVFAIFAQRPTLVRAQVPTPGFPSCSNPQGVVRVNYDSGNHGIVGSTSEYSGSDIVYDVEQVGQTQCFCSDDGSGIQTNWWRISSLTQDEIDTLKNLGWIFVPSGAVWGLDDTPYMARNSDYACTSSSTTSTNSSTASSDDSSGDGEVLGASTAAGSVLGLATTGNSVWVYMSLFIGIILITLGLFLKARSKSRFRDFQRKL